MSDDDKFVFDFPVWIIARKGNVELVETGRGDSIGGDMKGGGKYLSIFTDDDLASRIANEIGDSVSIAKILDIEEWTNLLKRIQKSEFTHLLVDPSSALATQGIVIRIQDELEDLQRERP